MKKYQMVLMVLVFCAGGGMFSAEAQKVDFTHAPQLESITYIHSNAQSIDLSQCAQLKVLDVSESQLTSLDLSCQTKLETLNISGTCITTLDLRSVEAIKNIENWGIAAYGNGEIFTRIIPGNLSALESLVMGPYYAGKGDGYTIQDFDISSCSKLQKLSLRNLPNYIVDKSWFPKLESCNN